MRFASTQKSRWDNLVVKMSSANSKKDELKSKRLFAKGDHTDRDRRDKFIADAFATNKKNNGPSSEFGNRRNTQVSADSMSSQEFEGSVQWSDASKLKKQRGAR